MPVSSDGCPLAWRGHVAGRAPPLHHRPRAPPEGDTPVPLFHPRRSLPSGRGLGIPVAVLSASPAARTRGRARAAVDPPFSPGPRQRSHPASVCLRFASGSARCSSAEPRPRARLTPAPPSVVGCNSFSPRRRVPAAAMAGGPACAKGGARPSAPARPPTRGSRPAGGLPVERLVRRKGFVKYGP